MAENNDFEVLYGKSAKHTDYKEGDSVRFWDRGVPGGQNNGTILHIVAATEKTPLTLVVSPEVGLFPVEIAVNEVIERL